MENTNRQRKLKLLENKLRKMVREELKSSKLLKEDMNDEKILKMVLSDSAVHSAILKGVRMIKRLQDFKKNKTPFPSNSLDSLYSSIGSAVYDAVEHYLK